MVNLTEEPAEVSVLAYDDIGSEYGPAILSLDANETAHFNSDDLEDGNSAKGLSGGVPARETGARTPTKGMFQPSGNKGRLQICSTSYTDSKLILSNAKRGPPGASVR